MTIKSLLLGSAAALAAVSGAQAADAIVAAEPEPLEYVRVCDAFGTGYFYIPGTETCLQIGGEVRFGVEIGDDISGQSSWDARTRARLHFQARTDTEYGALTSYIQLEATNDVEDVNSGVGLRQAYIELGGLRAGSFLGWWDDDIAGESDTLSNIAKFNSVRYTYSAETFSAGISLDEIEALYPGNNVGVSGVLSAALGGVDFQLLGGYDNGAEEGAVRAILNADVGIGTFGLAAVWASDPSAYYDDAEWSVAASYAAKVTDKLTITPAVSYFGDVNFEDDGFTTVDAWGASLLVEYAVTAGLTASAAVTYLDVDAPGVDNEIGGFLRLARSF